MPTAMATATNATTTACSLTTADGTARRSPSDLSDWTGNIRQRCADDHRAVLRPAAPGLGLGGVAGPAGAGLPEPDRRGRHPSGAGGRQEGHDVPARPPARRALAAAVR